MIQQTFYLHRQNEELPIFDKVRLEVLELQNKMFDKTSICWSKLIITKLFVDTVERLTGRQIEKMS